MRNPLPTIGVIVALWAIFSASSHAQPLVRVLVYGEHQGANVVYHYTVINNGTVGFNNFTVGSEYDPTDKETWPELGKLPVGWRYGKKGEIGTEILLDPASTNQPAGWRPWVYGKQDIDFFYLNWNGRTNSVEPGQTLSGFSVTVPRGKDANPLPMPADAELKYLNGHFTVGLPGSKGLQDIHGALERQDITPPFLRVMAMPTSLWPPNGKLVPITVSLSVKDDYDSQPEVKLESITANQPLADGDIAEAAVGTDDRQLRLAARRDGNNQAGRIYTLIYSAKDASGNKSTASVTVVVPHDQGK